MIVELIRGQKLKLADVLSSLQFFVNVAVQSPFITDVALFGLNSQGRLASDEYMVFYNQPVSPCQSLKLTQNTPSFCQFSLDLARLPSTIQKMVITLSIDGNGVMSHLGNSSVNLVDLQGQTLATFALTGAMFAQERALMALEIYKKDGIWRINAVGQGFDGGLPALVAYFGAEVAKDEPVAQNAPRPLTANPTTKLDLKKKLSLEKAQKTGNASIIDLTKKSLIQLEKKNLLDVKARVALVLDASGSMNWQYNNGDVQKIVNRLMPLAINFDDDGSFECWAFAQKTVRLDDVTLDNVNNFVQTVNGGHNAWRVGARINEEIPAIQAVIEHFIAIKDNVPTYVLFISDGGVGSGRQMQEILTACADLPIFWQFVGVGGSNYGILEKLDTMTGRVVDNCNFFAVDNINAIDDSQLYELLLNEFPKWLAEVTRKNLLTNRTFRGGQFGSGGWLGRIWSSL